MRELESLPPLLLEWYGRCARILPWRSEPTPYRVWVSEVMLQQTRVEAVRPYFLRFMDALPDIPALAAGCAAEAVGGAGVLQPRPEPPKGGPKGGRGIRRSASRLL